MGRPASQYRINWSFGEVELHDSYEEAVSAIEQRYPGAVIGHAGDLNDGGSRTLCWLNEDEACNDNGARSVAEIVPLSTPPINHW